jgi:LAS superfamily LD-carboxypeptidase LdcB
MLIHQVIMIICLSSCKQQPVANIPQEIRTELIMEKDTVKPITKSEIDFIMGKFQAEKHDLFVVIDRKYADRAGLYMQREAFDQFVKMYDAAKNNGILLTIKSACRNFDYQKQIWEKKWSGKTMLSNGINLNKGSFTDLEKANYILNYSSMPGSSRHHWGTDIDLNAFNNEYFESGAGLKIFNWLEQNASKYGFGRPYTVKNEARPNGYNEEKWHWSYLPTAKKYTDQIISNKQAFKFDGFLGYPMASEVNIIDNYILGIDKTCL